MASCMMQSRLQTRAAMSARGARPCSALRARGAPGAMHTSVPRLTISRPGLPNMRQSQLSQRRVVCQGLFGLGLPEIVVIAGVTALIFGPSKLPELGKGLGKTIKSFQSAAKEFETELKAATSEDESSVEKKTEAKEGAKKE